MSTFFDLVFNFMHNFVATLGSYKFNFYGLNVSIVDIILGFIVMSMVVSVFWKGARG